MKKANLIYLTFITVAVTFTSCNTSSSNDQVDGNNDIVVDSTQNESVTVEEDLSWTKNGITLSVVNDNPNFDDAMLELNVPGEMDNLESGKSVEFAFNVKNYELGNQTSDADNKMCANSSKGQHIHLIMNNEPYSAHYESQFNKDLPDGYYVALAFLSRSYHMSIKQPDAYLVREFIVGEIEMQEAFEETAPHMFYSRPKGEYTGEDTKKLLLDFYLINAQLAEDAYKVRATINGTEFIIEKWSPYFVEGLPMGENTFKLELLDPNGNLVQSKFNPVERTIMLSELN